MSKQEKSGFTICAKLLIAATFAVLLLSACGSPVTQPPVISPPPVSGDLFLVENLSGDVAGFTELSGQLTPLANSAARFAFPLFAFGADPNGTLVAALSGSTLNIGSLQAASIGAGGKLTVQTATTSVVSAARVHVSVQGVIAVSDANDALVRLFTVQNGQFVPGASASAGPQPDDVEFSGDGKFLYVADRSVGSISVFSVSSAAALQLIQTAQLPVATGEFNPALVRLRLSAAGNKIAATTFDGKIFVADVEATSHKISNAVEIHVAANANLEEVIFDPSGQNLYAVDQDNGGLYEFSLAGGAPQQLAGSPLATPLGPSGMATNSAGDRVYVVSAALSGVVTYTRDRTSGMLSSTGEIVGSGGLLAGRIVRVALR
jgi:DNA-binding beta-propeller fold protein YncE